jgi:hypothetical protein
MSRSALSQVRTLSVQQQLLIPGMLQADAVANSSTSKHCSSSHNSMQGSWSEVEVLVLQRLLLGSYSCWSLQQGHISSRQQL